jgi:hypothetical protein
VREAAKAAGRAAAAWTAAAEAMEAMEEDWRHPQRALSVIQRALNVTQ